MASSDKPTMGPIQAWAAALGDGEPILATIDDSEDKVCAQLKRLDKYFPGVCEVVPVTVTLGHHSGELAEVGDADETD